MADVFARDPEGNLVTLPAENAAKAEELGYTLETPEESKQRELEAKFGDSDLAAGLAGVARGATFGVSDAILGGWSPDTRQQLQGLAQANPDASMVGEVAGAVGTAFIPGAPANMVTKLGAAAERSAASALGLARAQTIAGKVLAKSAGGAVEGAAQGFGKAISDAALQGEDLKAEKLLAGGLMGGFLGAGASGIAAGIGAGVQRGAAKLEGKIAPDGAKGLVQDFARERALDSAGFIQSARKDLSFDEQKAVADEILGLFRRGKVKPGSNVKEILDAVQTEADEVGEAARNFYVSADKATNGGAMKYDRLRNRVNEWVSSLDEIQQEYVGPQIAKEMAAFEKKAAQGLGSFEDAWKLRRRIDETINFSSEKINATIKQDLRRVVDAEIKDQAEAVLGQEARETLEKLNQRYSKLATIRDVATKGVNRMEGNRAVSLTDYLGAIFGGSMGGVGGLALGIGAAGVNKLARERLPSLLAAKADLALQSGMVDAAVGAFDMAMGQLAAKSVEVGVKLGAGTAAERALRPGNEKKKGPGISPPDFNIQREELAQLVGKPEMLTQRVQAVMAQVPADAPESIKAAVGLTASRAVAHLESVMPKAPPSTQLPALDGTKPWKPSDAEVARFERHMRVVADPLSVYEGLAAGNVTRDAVEALKAVYPALHGDIQQRLAVQLASVKSQLPYAKRLSLGTLFGVPLDQSMQPGFIATLQATYAQQPQKQPGPTGAKLTIGAGELSASQRLEQRRS